MGDEVAERGTPEFYLQEASRLALLAIVATDSGVRLQMLEMAATFKRLAERALASNVIDFPQQKRESA